MIGYAIRILFIINLHTCKNGFNVKKECIDNYAIYLDTIDFHLSQNVRKIKNVFDCFQAVLLPTLRTQVKLLCFLELGSVVTREIIRTLYRVSLFYFLRCHSRILCCHPSAQSLENFLRLGWHSYFADC